MHSCIFMILVKVNLSLSCIIPHCTFCQLLVDFNTTLPWTAYHIRVQLIPLCACMVSLWMHLCLYSWTVPLVRSPLFNSHIVRQRNQAAQFDIWQGTPQLEIKKLCWYRWDFSGWTNMGYQALIVEQFTSFLLKLASQSCNLPIPFAKPSRKTLKVVLYICPSGLSNAISPLKDLYMFLTFHFM